MIKCDARNKNYPAFKSKLISVQNFFPALSVSTILVDYMKSCKNLSLNCLRKGYTRYEFICLKTRLGFLAVYICGL